MRAIHLMQLGLESCSPKAPTRGKSPIPSQELPLMATLTVDQIQFLGIIIQYEVITLKIDKNLTHLC